MHLAGYGPWGCRVRHYWSNEHACMQTLSSKLFFQEANVLILEPPKLNWSLHPLPPSIFREMIGLDAIILDFWMLSFKPPFLLSSFTLIKRFFSSSSVSALRVVWSAHLRLLIFLPAVLNPACESSSLAFHMMYSTCKINKNSDNIQCCPFPILNQVVFHILF